MYRQMLRYGYTAVENHHLRKYIFRKVLNTKFRTTNASPEAVNNTLQFLKAAAHSNGLERRVLYTVLHVEASKHSFIKTKKTDLEILAFNDGFYESLINEVNRTMNMCI